MNAQAVVETSFGREVDLWSALSTATRARLRALISEHGRALRRDAECAELYELDQLPNDLSVVLGEGTISVQPWFGYAARACVEPLTMSAEGFRRQVEAEGLVQRVVANW